MSSKPLLIGKGSVLPKQTLETQKMFPKTATPEGRAWEWMGIAREWHGKRVGSIVRASGLASSGIKASDFSSCAHR